ncbi:MAG TPA: zinc ribbon domain-containing protein [Pyrinomonadaceae bacterium]|nr:zinc ribbon domain-containing protein [Pyrinomonadaceae bacterium]
MSEPEIARRCSSCGVSLRQSAMFCPQCGNPIVTQQTTTEVSPTAPTQALRSVGPADDSLANPNPTPTPPKTAPPPQAQHHHASGLTGVADNVRDRVEKIRHVSSVVIDQAAYDPSLRFLLVAAVLFVLFIVLVILSKVIG